MLAPIYELLFNKTYDSLLLNQDQVKISYKTYKTEESNEMQEIVDQQLAPGTVSAWNSLKLRFVLIDKVSRITSVASVGFGHQGQVAVDHAMVLDTYDQGRDMLIFKNTTGNDKKFEIKRSDQNAPKELFFVHIEVPDMANLPSQEEREPNEDQD